MQARKYLAPAVFRRDPLPAGLGVTDRVVVIGNVLARRRTETGLKEVPHDVTFAFAFSAFRPQGVFHLK